METTQQDYQKELYQRVRRLFRQQFDEAMDISLHKWLVHYREDVSFLYEVFGLFTQEEKELEDTEKGIHYHWRNQTLRVTASSFSGDYPKIVALKSLQFMIDNLQSYLPIGSVVSLKKEYMENAFPAEVEEVRFIIGQRFACIPDTQTFYQYGGTVYPLGSQVEGRMLYFTPPLIEKVIHTGFQDETDLAFTFRMKEELILSKGYHSIGLVEKSVQEDAQNYFTERG